MNKKYSFNEKYFEVIDNEQKAYWLGFLYADGYVYNDCKRGKYNVTITLKNTDKILLEQFKQDLNSNHPIKDIEITSRDNPSHACSLYIGNKKIVQDLIKLGCFQNKSKILKPPTLQQVPLEYIPHFIRGYFDGDGSVFISNEKHWRHGTITEVIHYRFVGTPEMMEWIKNQINLKGHLGEAHNHQSYTKELCYKRRKKLVPFFTYLYKDATRYLKRKKDIFIKHIKERCSETIIAQLRKENFF